MIYKIYIDDIRNPTNSYPTTKNLDWVVVRSYAEFVSVIEKNGLPYLVSFDHDLATEHYSKDTDPKNYTEKTGMDCVKFLVNYCIENKKSLPAYEVHSMNPVGKSNMVSYLESYLRSTQDR